MERGLNHRYKNIYDNARLIVCHDNTGMYYERRKEVEPVRFADVFTTFLVIFVGWFAALWIFLTEKLFRKKRKFFYLQIVASYL